MNEQQLKDTFGQVLRNLRKDKKLAQEKLALECELDRTYISMLERGVRQPSLSTIFVLAEKLGKKPSEVVEAVEKLIDP